MKRNFTVPFKKKCGFTLVELIIYMGLLATFLIIVSSVFIQALDVQLESESVSSIEQDGRYLLSRMSYDIGRASSINNPSSPGSTSADLQFVSAGTIYNYTLTGGNIIYSYGTMSAQLNSYGTTVSGLQFSRKGSASASAKLTMSVVFTLTSKFIREKGADTKQFSATFGTR